MFLDEQSFYPGPRPIQPEPPVVRAGERTLTWFTLGLTLTMLVLPVSAVGLADLVHYLSR